MRDASEPLAAGPAAAALLLRALWFALIPALLTAVFLRFLLPEPNVADAAFEQGLRRLASNYPVYAPIGLFLLFAGLIRYWRRVLPGGPFLSASPHGGVEGSSLRACGGFALLLVVAALLAFTLRGSVFQIYRLTSGSMLPSLLPGEYVLASRNQYSALKLPARADLVVFQREGHEAAGDLVKRVIGLPGDRIEMVRGGHPVINGWAVPSCDAGQYLQFTADEVVEGRLLVEFLGSAVYLTVHTPWGKPMVPYTVKPGEVFVIGDDRNESRDSRSWADGSPVGLQLREINGRVLRSLAMAVPGRAPRYRWLDSTRRLTLDLPGVDTRDLEAGIERCLAARPARTEPPPP